MVSHETIRDARDYVNYAFHITARGAAEVTADISGMSNNIQYMLGQLAWKTSEFLGQAEGTAVSMATAAIGAFGAATKSAAKYEKAIASVEAISGRQVSKELVSEKAIQMSNQFGMSVESMTGGLESLARAGVTANESIEALLESSVQMSVFEGRDLEESINSLLSTTNLLNPDIDVNSVEFAQTVEDLNQKIISTSESSPINAKNIMDTLQHVGGYASAASLDQQDLFAVIAQLGAKGTKGEIAGTSLRAFVSAGQKDTAQRALEKIGLSVSDLWDESGQAMLPVSEMKQVLDDALQAAGYSKQEKLEFYSDFVGYKQANQIMKIDPTEVDKYNDKISNAMSLTDKMSIILGTTEGNWQQLVETTRNFMLEVGQHVLTFLNPLVATMKIVAKVLSAIPGSTEFAAIALMLVTVKGVAVSINILLPTLLAFLSKFNTSIFNVREFFTGLKGDLEQSKDILTSLGDKAKMNDIVNAREADISNKMLVQGLENDVREDMLRQEYGFTGYFEDMGGNIRPWQNPNRIAYEKQTRRNVFGQEESFYVGQNANGETVTVSDLSSLGIETTMTPQYAWDNFEPRMKELLRNKFRPDETELQEGIEYRKLAMENIAHDTLSTLKSNAEQYGDPVFASPTNNTYKYLGNILKETGTTVDGVELEIEYISDTLDKLHRDVVRFISLFEENREYGERTGRRQTSGAARREGAGGRHQDNQRTRYYNYRDVYSGIPYNVRGNGRQKYIREVDRPLFDSDRNMGTNRRNTAMPYRVREREDVFKSVSDFLSNGKISFSISRDDLLDKFGQSSDFNGAMINAPLIYSDIAHGDVNKFATGIEMITKHEVFHQIDVEDADNLLDGQRIAQNSAQSTMNGYNARENMDEQMAIVASYGSLSQADRQGEVGQAEQAKLRKFVIANQRVVDSAKLSGEDMGLSTEMLSATVDAYQNNQLEFLESLLAGFRQNKILMMGQVQQFNEEARRAGKEDLIIDEDEYRRALDDTERIFEEKVEATRQSLGRIEQLRRDSIKVADMFTEHGLSQATVDYVSFDHEEWGERRFKHGNNKPAAYDANIIDEEQNLQKDLAYVDNFLTGLETDREGTIRRYLGRAVHPSGYSQGSERIAINKADAHLYELLTHSPVKEGFAYKKDEYGSVLGKRPGVEYIRDEEWFTEGDYRNRNRPSTNATSNMGGKFKIDKAVLNTSEGEQQFTVYRDQDGNVRYARGLGKAANQIYGVNDGTVDESGPKFYRDSHRGYKYYDAEHNEVNLKDVRDSLAIDEEALSINSPDGYFSPDAFKMVGAAIKDQEAEKSNLISTVVDEVQTGVFKNAQGEYQNKSFANVTNFDDKLLRLFNGVDAATGNILNEAGGIKYYYDPYSGGYYKKNPQGMTQRDLNRLSRSEVFDEQDLMNDSSLTLDENGNYISQGGEFVFYKTKVDGKYVGQSPLEREGNAVSMAEIMPLLGTIKSMEDVQQIIAGMNDQDAINVLNTLSSTWRNGVGTQYYAQKDNLNPMLRNISSRSDVVKMHGVLEEHGIDTRGMALDNPHDRIKQVIDKIETIQDATEKAQVIEQMKDILQEHEEFAPMVLESKRKLGEDSLTGFSQYLLGDANSGYAGENTAANILAQQGININDEYIQGSLQQGFTGIKDSRHVGYEYAQRLREMLINSIKLQNYGTLDATLTQDEMRKADEALAALVREYFKDAIPEFGTVSRYILRQLVDDVEITGNRLGIDVEVPYQYDRTEQRTPESESHTSGGGGTPRGPRSSRNDGGSGGGGGSPPESPESEPEGEPEDEREMWWQHIRQPSKRMYNAEFRKLKTQYMMENPGTSLSTDEEDILRQQAKENVDTRVAQRTYDTIEPQLAAAEGRQVMTLNRPQSRLARYAEGINTNEVKKSMEQTKNNIAEHINNITETFTPLLNVLSTFNGKLYDLANVFPILTPVAMAFDSIISPIFGFVDGLQSLGSFMGDFLNFTEKPPSWLKEMFKGTLIGESVSKLYNTVKEKLGKVVEKAVGGLDKMFGKAFAFLANNPLIAAGIAALVATIGVALFASKKYHDKQIKEINEEKKQLKGEKKAATALYTGSAKTLRSGAGTEWERQASGLNFEKSANKLEGIVAQEQRLIQKQYSANQSIWGEYGAINQLKLAFEWTGMVEGDHYGDEHENTSKSIRDIYENQTKKDTWDMLTFWNAFGLQKSSLAKNLGLEDSGAGKQVEAFYKANEQTFTKMEYYDDELSSLYNTETALIKRYGSKDAARQSGEWDKAVQNTAAETGSTKEEVESYLDWMQTEWVVQQSTEYMQSNADRMKGEAETQAYLIKNGRYGEAMNFSSENIEKQQELMIDAQAEEIANQAKMDLFWEGVMMELMGFVQIIKATLELILAPFKFIITFLSNWANNGFWNAMDGLSDQGEQIKEDFTEGVSNIEAGDSLIASTSQITAESTKEGWEAYNKETNRRNNPNYGLLDLSSKYFDLGNKVNGEALSGESNLNNGSKIDKMNKDLNDTLNSHKGDDKSTSGSGESDSGKNGGGAFDDDEDKKDNSSWANLIPIVGAYNGAKTIYDWFNSDDEEESGDKGKDDDPNKGADKLADKSKIAETLQNNDITIQNININTEDDPEAIKTALMNLLIELEKQVADRGVASILNGIANTNTNNNNNNNNGNSGGSGTQT